MLYRDPEPMSATEISTRVREAYDEYVPEGRAAHLGPRSISYGDSRSLLEQMQGCQNEAARIQLAITLHAVSITLLTLRTNEEV